MVLSFTERSGSDTIGFLLPHPLREKKDEFETGSQMTARHLAWAREATGGETRTLKRVRPHHVASGATTIRCWPGRPSRRSSSWASTCIGGVPTDGPARCRHADLHGHLAPRARPRGVGRRRGRRATAQQIAKQLGHRRGPLDLRAHGPLRDRRRDPDARLPQRRSREAQRAGSATTCGAKGETDASLGRPIDAVEYPAEAMYEKTLPRDADLPTRKIMYYAGKFGQWWSVKQLRQTHRPGEAVLRRACPAG